MRTVIRAALVAGTLIALGVIPALANTVVVTQTGFTFSPASVTVNQGDTVRWVWSDNFHTVTNGTGSADAAAGALFDAPLDSGHTSFQFTFTNAGTYAYFCRFHEAFGMKGRVTVETSVPAKPTTWGKLKNLYRSVLAML